MPRCAHCRKLFDATGNGLQVMCSPRCAYEWVKAKPERAAAHRKRAMLKEGREWREETMTPGQAAKAAQKDFNAWVRERDRGLPCVSCNHPDDGSRQRHASHYRPAGSNPALRFEPDNCWASCSICNNYKSGNLTAYRIELIKRIGLERVMWLEGPHELPHRTVDDFRAIAKTYRQLTRTLARDESNAA